MIKTRVVKAKNGALRPEDLSYCVEAVRAGGVVIFPTDTVYGIGCNAFHHEAVQRVYRLKGRDYKKPLPILLESSDQLGLVAAEVLPEASALIEAFWPGPLTLVVKTGPLAMHAARGRHSIAVRVPDHGVVRDLLAGTNVPLAATSANRSGKKSMKTGASVLKEFSGKVDVIIDGGACPIGRESSVVDVSHFPFSVLREGALTRSRLARALYETKV